MKHPRSRRSRIRFLLALTTIVITTSLWAGGSRHDQVNPATPLTVEEAVVRYYAGDIEGAIDGLRLHVSLFPDDHDALQNLALLLREAGNLDEAAMRLNDALSDDPVTARELGITLVLAGRPESAVSVLQDLSGDDPIREFWLGLALLDAGRTEAATTAFARAAELREHFPYAHLFRGRIALDEQRWGDSITHFERALRQDANLTSALLPMAEARIATGQPETGYTLLSRAVISRPWDEPVQVAKSRLEQEYPELLVRRETEVAERRATSSAPRVIPVAESLVADAPRVRIGLAENVEAIHVKTGGYYGVFGPGGILVAQGERDEVLLVERLAGEEVSITVDRGDPKYHGGGPVEIRYDDPAATTMIFNLEYGHGQFSAGREDRSYRGLIRFLSWADRGLTVVNELDVESYLLSVVPSEMPALWPTQALEAQTVAARSYTLAPRPRFHPRGFDLLGSVTSAFYRGVGGEHPRTTEAVLATAGLVLMDGNVPLNAVYSANTAGYTEGSESVWGFASALVGVSDPLLPQRSMPAPPVELESWLAARPESHSSNPRYSSMSAYRWVLWVSVEELEGRLTGQNVGSVTGVVTRGRGTSGRVEAVEVTGTEGTVRVERDLIRSRLGGLRSNLFTVSPRLDADGRPTHFVFTGAGWGHGVGMCQSGAAGMAAAGYTSVQILEHYYPTADLRQLY